MEFFNKIIAFFTAVIAFFASFFGAEVGKKIDMDQFSLVWADEFDGDSLDTSKWIYLYTESDKAFLRKGGYWHRDMISLQDGNLHIATKYFDEGYKGGKAGWYTGAVSTKSLFEQKHGYFEIRCILPKGYGVWSAFWMNCDGMSQVDGSGRDGAEIDIFESPYYNKNKISSNIHYDGYGEDIRSANLGEYYIHANNPYEEFNTYALEWNEDEYIFYINGRQTIRSSFGGASQVPEYLIASVEVGGQNGVAADSWAGKSADTNTDGVSDFIVDYVRVYQYK